MEQKEESKENLMAQFKTEADINSYIRGLPVLSDDRDGSKRYVQYLNVLKYYYREYSAVRESPLTFFHFEKLFRRKLGVSRPNDTVEGHRIAGNSAFGEKPISEHAQIAHDRDFNNANDYYAAF